MRALIVYESMYGNTHKIATAISEGFDRSDDVTVVSADRLDRAALELADLVVLGAPTHAHGMPRASTRKAAVEAARKNPALTLEVDPSRPGLREWLDNRGRLDAKVAAFDTRLNGPAFVMGRASKRIARKLRHHGVSLLMPPESFFVTKDNRLVPGEVARAQEWGRRLSAAMHAVAAA